MTEQKQTHAFQAEVTRVLGLVINSLYSNKEVFLRELVSNASDAIDKRRFLAISEPALLGESPLAIRLTPDREKKTLTFSDDGIGMSSEELVQNLGTVAHSGSTDFMDKLKAALDQKSEGKDGDDVSLIGQFGVGFYSAYLVADRVDVLTRRAGSEQAHLWSSDAGETYSIEPAEREAPGTDVVLHLKEDQLSLLDSYELTRLVKKYSDFVAHPILVAQPKDEDEEGEDEEGADKSETDADATAKGDDEPSYEQANSSNALWRRRPSEITDEQYGEFYRHLTHDWEAPLARKHFHVEGTQMFSGLLFIPKRPPFDLFSPDQQHGVRLHVKRVFIMDDCEELLPKWLRFVRGVVDSEDLPLNVSRELLQDSRVVRTIRKQVVRRCLDMIEELARPAETSADDAAGEGEDKGDASAKPAANEAYNTFWAAYGAVLKEGLHFEPEYADRLAKLVRYETTAQPGLTSLADYVSRMKEGQDAIYYVVGASRATVENAPHLEALKSRGYEVLLMVDGVDQWALDGLREFDGKKLLSATDAALDLGETKPTEAEKEELDALVTRFRDTLKEHVSEVRLTSRLTDSAACLVSPAGGLPPYMERLLRLQNPDMPVQKRVLELNPTHPIVTGLRDLLRGEADEARDAQVREWVELVHDQALLAEGSPVHDPAKLVQRMSALLSDAVRRAATA
ncbi:MAG: molecular chaperone HtpG [Sandaracinaceae bacterium]|nr:molecular chaperone HtpG [Myxococcales bacterium]MCB9662133.1 molecular chaperone HtpG [Sandaracinaceae bacterium]